MRQLIAPLILVILAAGNISRAAELTSSADPGEGWKLASKTKDLTVYARIPAGARVKEFKAIGEIDAPSRAVDAVLDDLENYTKFMPFTAECRLIKREGDSLITYQRLSPKLCEDRDYTLRVRKKSRPGTDGLVYSHQWQPANELGPPEKKGVVRVKICEGGWLLEPAGANKTTATYNVYSDAGGAMPVFLANRVSQMGIGKVFAAVRKQVKEPKYNVAE
jgi:hypothetical protein